MDLKEHLNKLNNQVMTLKLDSSVKPSNICLRLDKIYDKGKEMKQKKKYNEAYIYFRRWMVCVQWLKLQRLNEKAMNRYFPDKQVEEAKKHISDIFLILKEECESAKPPIEKDIKDASKEIRSENDLDISLRLPEIPNEEPQPKEKDEVTCTDLYKLMNRVKEQNKFVIIDVRKEQDYDKSRLGIEDSIIHIPAENIQPNQQPEYYQNLLLDDVAAVKRFNNLSNYDIIILLDSNSSVNTLPSDSPLAIFKECLQNWNLNRKKQILILKGGFQEWEKKYPTNIVKTPINKFFHGIDLPPEVLDSTNLNHVSAIQDSYNSSPILSTGRRLIGKKVAFNLSSDASILDTNEIINSMSYTDMTNAYDLTPTVHQPVPVNGSYFPYYQNGSSDKPVYNPTINHMDPKVVIKPFKIPVIDRPSKPIVDRSSKPAWGKRISNEMTQLKADLEKVIISIQPYMTKINARIPLDDWEIEQLDIYRKKEKELSEKIIEVEEKLKQQNKLYPVLPDKVLPVSVSRKILPTQPSQPAQPVVTPSQPVQPTHSPAVKPVLSPFYKQSLSDKENALQEPRVLLKRLALDQPQRMEIDGDEDDDNGDNGHSAIRKEPLKGIMAPKISGLKRSHSSPNLAKLLEQKPSPEVPDRSLKPKAEDDLDEIRRHHVISSKDREQRMEPVYASSYMHPGVTGLKNLGNSCYMNSIIQCLSNTVYLANYFNNNNYTNDLNSNKPFHRSVADEVAQVIKALWRGTYKSISPRDLRGVVGDYKRQFQSYDQQDSHEFLTFLLDWMHNDLKKTSKISYSGRLLTVAEKEWEKHMNNQSSIISNLFFGMLRSTIKCCHCEKISTTYETFNSLTVSLTSTIRCSLDECFEKFLQSQRVSGWKCPNCKVPRDGMKKFDLAKLPPIVVIHLNRFGDTSGWLEKKNTNVDFPLTNFNLKKYLVQDNDTFNTTPNSTYNLYAISNHYGTMEGGHYTAYCKSAAQQKWYKYDDHTVVEATTTTVRNQSSSAYLLFYALASAEAYLNS